MKILILGGNGFIGSHLCETILANTDWQIQVIDLSENNLTSCMQHQNFNFYRLDIIKNSEHVRRFIEESDVVLPLAAIANPSTYVSEPLRVFDLDFMANLAVVRLCAQLNKRVIFPSTSEVYGMCPDAEFDEKTSVLVTGPVEKERWIYSTSKQMLDRVIYALGKHENLSYTLFRPFNWYGPRLDSLENPNSRVITKFISNIIKGENIVLVNGGAQQRSFMYVDDGMRALLTIIANEDSVAADSIFNLGNPAEDVSIHDLAVLLVDLVAENFPEHRDNALKVKFVNKDGKTFYGAGYQDVERRVPSIKAAVKALGWSPTITLKDGLKKTLDYFL